MKLRIQTDGPALASALREHVEQRVRLIVGARAARIDGVQILLANAPDARTEVRCRVKLKDMDAAIGLPVEAAQSVEDAVELTIWRLRHFLDRRALRSEPGRRSA